MLNAKPGLGFSLPCKKKVFSTLFLHEIQQKKKSEKYEFKKLTFLVRIEAVIILM